MKSFAFYPHITIAPPQTDARSQDGRSTDNAHKCESSMESRERNGHSRGVNSNVDSDGRTTSQVSSATFKGMHRPGVARAGATGHRTQV